MGNEDNFRITKFNGSNFGLWKRHVSVVLRSKKLDEASEKPKINTDGVKVEACTGEQDVDAQSIIFGVLDQSVIQKITSCATSAEIWERLCQIYQNTSQMNGGKIFGEYYAYSKDPKDDMSTHISKAESLALQLEQVGEKHSELSVMSKLLNCLPSAYNSLKEACDSVHPDLQTRSNLIARTLAHDVKIGSTSEQQADIALVVSGQGGGEKRDKDWKRKTRCYNCNKYGHYKRECKSGGNHKESETGVALIVGSGGTSDNWIIDSGASRHTFCRRDWFATSSSTSEELKVANKQWVKVTGVGSVKIRFKLGKSYEEVELKQRCSVNTINELQLIRYEHGVRKGCNYSYGS